MFEAPRDGVNVSSGASRASVAQILGDIPPEKHEAFHHSPFQGVVNPCLSFRSCLLVQPSPPINLVMLAPDVAERLAMKPSTTAFAVAVS